MKIKRKKGKRKKVKFYYIRKQKLFNKYKVITNQYFMVI